MMNSNETNAAIRLPAITVTAQKTPADVQSLPVSVTAVTQPTLDEAGVRYVNDAAAYAPNVFISEFTARKLSNPRFRGIGSSPNNPGVTTFLDGVPQLNANSSSLELVDVNQIEFVRGPQGALFGRNTIGGLINLTSTRPSLTQASGDLTGTYGNYNLWDVRGGFSAPLIKDELALGVGIGYTQRDGYTKNDVTGHTLDNREAFFGKGQLLWSPGQNWEVRLILSGERARDGDYALNDLAAARANPFHSSRDYEGYTHRDVLAPTLQVNHAGSAVDFAMTTGLVWWETKDSTDLDYSAAPLITRDNQEKDFQFTEELRLSSAKDAPINLSDALKLHWQAGLSFFTQNYEQDAVNNYGFGVLYQPGSFGAPGFPPTYSNPNSQHTPQSNLDDLGVGGYAQATVTAWEKLEVSVGVRGDYENKKADLNTYFTTPDPFLGPPTHVSAEKDFANASPQFALGYHVTPDQLVYGTVARGFKAGGFNSASPAGSEGYGQERSWNYEVGWKTSWFDHRLTANLAAFYIDWRNVQVNVPNSYAPGQYYIANAAGAMSKGLEFELTGRLCAHLDVFGGVGYNDARFLNGSVSSGANVSGKKLTYTPDYNAHGGLQFSQALCHAASVYARAEVIAYGGYQYDDANTAGQSAYTLANFRAGVRGRHWFAEGWARNAFDTRYVPIAFAYPGLAPSGFVGETGAPVTYGVTAGVKF